MINSISHEAEIVIVGGGIVGLTIARKLINLGFKNIKVIEKESEIALHASGRNSGVLHAGIYYPANTLKAKLCLSGNRMMQTFCKQNNLYLHNVGKVIVARTPEELPMLFELEHRAKTNGANVTIVDEAELNDIEPHAKTVEKALYSIDTAIVNPKQIMQMLLAQLTATQNFTIFYDTKFLQRLDNNTINTTRGRIHFKYLINCAGAYADKIAHQFDVGKCYTFLPFKGIYKKLTPEKAHLIRGNVYPVPDIRNPFLGVHFTKNFAGDVYVGPTAIPAFGRENYGFFDDVSWESASILYKNFILLLQNAKVRNVALTEPLKYFKKYFFNDAKKLVKSLEPDWLLPTPKVGLRPQLVNWQTKELEMDFVIEKYGNTLHILNAISPAFTSSMAFADYIIDKYFLTTAAVKEQVVCTV